MILFFFIPIAFFAVIKSSCIVPTIKLRTRYAQEPNPIINGGQRPEKGPAVNTIVGKLITAEPYIGHGQYDPSSEDPNSIEEDETVMWNKTAITPGTRFMVNLNLFIQKYYNKKDGDKDTVLQFSLKDIIGGLEGFTGADIEAVCREAALITMRANKKKVTKSHFEEAISRVRPTVTHEMLQYYQKMEERLTSGLSNIKRSRETGFGMETM